MTNLEKFLEVFGYEEKADNIDFQCLCPCVVEGSCEKCRHYNKKTKGCDIEKFWQSEYHEPKQKIFDYLTATGQGMIEGEKIANDEWVKAINAIKDDFKRQAKRQKEKEERKSDGKVVEVFFGTKKILRIIAKHTKELMK